MKRINYFQRGVGLLEILIALAISAIMLLAITNMYGFFAQNSNQQKKQSLIQDQANFAFLSLKRAIRMAGAGICVNPVAKVQSGKYLHQAEEFDNFPSLLKNFKKLDAKSRLHSFSNVTSGDLGVSVGLEKNSDVLLVIYSNSDTRRIIGVDGTEGLSKPSSPYHTRILSSTTFPQKQGQSDEEKKEKTDLVFYKDAPTWVMISDCNHTGIFKYTEDDINKMTNQNILPPPGNKNKNPKGFIYNFIGNTETNQFSLLSRLHAKLFFVASDTIYAQDLLSPKKELEPIATYVKKMEIKYFNPEKKKWVSTENREGLNNWSEEWPVQISLEMQMKNGDSLETFSRVLNIRN